MTGGDISQIPEENWVSIPPEMGIAPEVHEQAAGVPLKVRLDQVLKTTVLVCDLLECGQEILALATSGGSYRIRTRDVASCLLAHLMQRHGWTREGPGNGA
jgi:hypothetical protein